MLKSYIGRRVAAVVVAASMVAACATAPEKVSASYVSPLQYGNYDCDQIRAEMVRLTAHVAEVAGAQKRQARNDQIAVGVGLVLFWPALFFLMSDDKKEELARMKGEYDALESAAIQKKCPVAEEIKAARDQEKAN